MPFQVQELTEKNQAEELQRWRDAVRWRDMARAREDERGMLQERVAAEARTSGVLMQFVAGGGFLMDEVVCSQSSVSSHSLSHAASLSGGLMFEEAVPKEEANVGLPAGHHLAGSSPGGITICCAGSPKSHVTAGRPCIRDVPRLWSDFRISALKQKMLVPFVDSAIGLDVPPAVTESDNSECDPTRDVGVRSTVNQCKEGEKDDTSEACVPSAVNGCGKSEVDAISAGKAAATVHGDYTGEAEEHIGVSEVSYQDAEDKISEPSAKDGEEEVKILGSGGKAQTHHEIMKDLADIGLGEHGDAGLLWKECGDMTIAEVCAWIDPAGS